MAAKKKAAAKKRAAPKGAKKPAKGGMGSRLSRINWAPIVKEYVGSLEHISLRKLAIKHGVDAGKLRARAAREGWSAQRKAQESQAVAAAVREAFDDRVRCGKGLRRLAYREKLGQVQQIIQLRRQQGNDWKPHEHRSHAETVHMLLETTMGLLGMDMVEKNDDQTMPLPAYIPEDFMLIELEARKAETDDD